VFLLRLDSNTCALTIKHTQVNGVLSEIQQAKGFGGAFKNADVLLLQVSNSTLKNKLSIYERADRDFILKNLDPIQTFFRTALAAGAGTNLVKQAKTPPKSAPPPEGVTTRSATQQSKRRSLRPRG
jgi:hypothetical protein